MDALGAIIGPAVGLLIVTIAYLLGVCLSIKCCRASYINYSSSHDNMIDPGISIISRNMDYFVGIPRAVITPNSTPSSSRSNTSFESQSEKPDYPPPSYEELRPPQYDELFQSPSSSGHQVV